MMRQSRSHDLYDYVFYLSRGTAVNLKHLTARLAQSGYIPQGKQITIEDVKEMLRMRFINIDFTQAKQDALPFIRNPDALNVWNTDFFCKMTESLKADT